MEEGLPHHELNTEAVSGESFGAPFLHTDHHEELTIKSETKWEMLSNGHAHPFLHDNFETHNIGMCSLAFRNDMNTAYEML